MLHIHMHTTTAVTYLIRTINSINISRSRANRSANYYYTPRALSPNARDDAPRHALHVVGARPVAVLEAELQLVVELPRDEECHLMRWSHTHTHTPPSHTRAHTVTTAQSDEVRATRHVRARARRLKVRPRGGVGTAAWARCTHVV